MPHKEGLRLGRRLLIGKWGNSIRRADTSMRLLYESWEQQYHQTHLDRKPMPNELLNCSRPFQIWEYTVGHAQLLLRSPKAVDLPTRVDVLFKNVAAIHLQTNLDSLRVSEAIEGEEIGLHSGLGATISKNRKIFVVRGSDFVGYVIAGAIAWHEDDGEYHDPSFFRMKQN